MNDQECRVCVSGHPCSYRTIGGSFFGCTYINYCDFQLPRDSRFEQLTKTPPELPKKMNFYRLVWEGIIYKGHIYFCKKEFVKGFNHSLDLCTPIVDGLKAEIKRLEKKE